MIVVITPRMAGPLAVAIAGLRKWYQDPDSDVRNSLAQLQSMLQKEATRGHSPTRFDPGELAAQACHMKPLAVTYEQAGDLLARSPRTIARLVKDERLDTIGEGAGTRVVVASIEAYVAREVSREAVGA